MEEKQEDSVSHVYLSCLRRRSKRMKQENERDSLPPAKRIYSKTRREKREREKREREREREKRREGERLLSNQFKPVDVKENARREKNPDSLVYFTAVSFSVDCLEAKRRERERDSSFFSVFFSPFFVFLQKEPSSSPFKLHTFPSFFAVSSEQPAVVGNFAIFSSVHFADSFSSFSLTHDKTERKKQGVWCFYMCSKSRHLDEEEKLVSKRRRRGG